MALGRHPNHVALVREALDAVHQSGHEKESAPVLSLEVVGLGGTGEALVLAKPASFVEISENMPVQVDIVLDLH